MDGSLGQGSRTPRPEYAGPFAASQPQAAPSSARSASFVPPPPQRSEVPPQPPTSGWFPSGPPPPHSRGSWSSSESEASDAESESSSRDSAFARLADLIYDVCPNSRLLLDDSRPPCCEFEGWFGQPEFQAFGFPEVGAITLPDPVRWLSVRPLAGLEGQRCGALGRGAVAVRLPHSFPLRPSSIQGSHLPALVPPLHQRGGAGGGHSGPCGQECGGACSSALPRLLQLAFCCVEDLGVLETRHRSLDPQFVRGCVSLPHGDHTVCPALHSSGGLDGLHRPQGSLPASPCPSGLSSLPAVCGSGQCLPVLCPLLRPFHCASGLHTGHGSCFRHSPLLGYPDEVVPRRLARPVLFPRLSPSQSSSGSRSLPGAGDCGQSREVSPGSISGRPVPRGGD